MKTFVVAKVFIVNGKGELLTLRRSQTDTRRPGELDFPGGWVDEGEDVLVAAKRETFEEVGLAITKAKLVFGLSDLTDYGSGTWVVFLAHAPEQFDVQLSAEHDAYEWLDPTKLLERLTYDRQRKMLQYIIDNGLLTAKEPDQ